jgi:DNA-directed RNA polymerase specialized sigma24 family protein
MRVVATDVFRFSNETAGIIMNISTGTLKLATKRSKNRLRGTEAPKCDFMIDKS